MTAPKGFEAGGFEQLLDAYGSRFDRWPEQLRAPAREWLAKSKAAQLAWERASRLDQVLGAAPDVEPSASLMARIAAIPITSPAPRATAWWPFGASWAPLLGWSMAALLGLWVGGVSTPMLAALDVPTSSSSSELDQAESEDEGSLAEEWNDLAELAFGAELVLEDE